MRYLSTRGSAPELGFCDALLAGLATDGGLYVPQTWPRVTPLVTNNYAQQAAHIMFNGDVYSITDIACELV